MNRGTHTLATLNADQWKMLIVRNGHDDVDVTKKVTSVTWTEPKDSAIDTGAITWTDPKGVVQKKIVRSGDTLVLQHAPRKGAPFVEVFRMRMREPSLTESTGARSFNFTNDLQNLQQSLDDFKFTKDKKHPTGWRVDEIVRYVCDRYGLSALIPVCEARITNRTWLNTDPLTVINDAFRVERTKNGRRFVLSFRRGVLVITPLRRSKALIGMAAALIEAVYTESFDPEFATAVTLRANPTKTKAKDAKGRRTVQGFKLTLDLTSPAGIRRWGYVHRINYLHGVVATAAEAQQLGMRHLAKIAKPVRIVTLTHPGNVSTRKGDAINISLRDINLRKLVWVAEVAHKLDPTGYTMDVTCVLDDPYADVKEDRVDENESNTTNAIGRNSGKTSTGKLGKVPLTNTNRLNGPSKQTAGDELAARAGRVRG